MVLSQDGTHRTKAPIFPSQSHSAPYPFTPVHNHHLLPEQALARLQASLHTTQRARAAGQAGARRLVGLVGKPGVGKSSFSAFLQRNLPNEWVAVVPMDGFHLSQAVLHSLGRAARKGAPDTFDVAGFVTLLQRLRHSPDQSIYYPVFDRKLEESIAAQGVVTPATQLVLVEGNYLLHDQDGWQAVQTLLDECWMLTLDQATRLDRLTARHIAFGKSPQDAQAWATGSDEANAKRIAQGAHRANYVVACDTLKLHAHNTNKW